MDYSGKDKKRVLHIFGILNRGGAETRTLEFIRRNKDKPVIFDFIALTGAKGVLDDDFRQVIGGEIYYMRLNSTFFFKYIKLLRKNKYDVVHSHVLMVSALFLMIAWFAGVKTRIAHLRSTGTDTKSKLRSIRDAFLKRLMLIFATNIVTVSESVAKAIFGTGWSGYRKIKPIYNGFTLIENPAVKSNRKVKIGHIGRFDPSKNHHFLSEIYKIICDADPDVLCTMTGRLDNNIYPAVSLTLKSLSNAGRVIIHSENSNIPEELRTYDILITTSLWEGLPGVIIEALSAGVPVIASGIEPNKEVASKISGITIVEGWDKNDWKKQLVALVNEVKTADKAETVKRLQASFLASPFYYQNTDNEMLKIYQAQ